jgi:hypothetical protein
MEDNEIQRFKLIQYSRLTSPPVSVARSCRLAFLFSPKPGALMAQTCSNAVTSD